MTQTTVSIPEDLDEALAAYGRDRGLGTDLDAAVAAALRDALTDRGYLLPFRPFRVTTLHRTSGPTDVSQDHDRYVAEGEASGPG